MCVCVCVRARVHYIKINYLNQAVMWLVCTDITVLSEGYVTIIPYPNEWYIIRDEQQLYIHCVQIAHCAEFNQQLVFVFCFPGALFVSSVKYPAIHAF